MITVLQGEALARLRTLPAESIHCVVTSPPYWGLRDNGEFDGVIGNERTVEEHVSALVAIFREVRRVLRDDGTLWLNYGDMYYSGNRGARHIGNEKPCKQHTNIGNIANVSARTRSPQRNLKDKDLILMPARVALALQADGWWLRSEIVWHKPNCMPESVQDRPSSAHEKIFLLSKAKRYFYDHVAVRQPAKQTALERASRARNQIREVPGQRPHQGSAVRLRPNTNAPVKPRGHSRRQDGLPGMDGMSKEEQMAKGANLKNVWEMAVSAYAGAHYATFPPRLAERCILAGTSAHGRCGHCGAPWRRITKDTPAYSQTKAKQRQQMKTVRGSKGKLVNVAYSGLSAWPEHITVGWEPSCCCEGGEVRPCVVLDPFGGAGPGPWGWWPNGWVGRPC